jgi:hypothetical protein
MLSILQLEPESLDLYDLMKLKGMLLRRDGLGIDVRDFYLKLVQEAEDALREGDEGDNGPKDGTL